MSKFFSKFLAVEGEIKEGDICFFKQFNEFGHAKMVFGELCFVSFPNINKGSLTSPISRNLDDKRSYKLFLCSRDIQVGNTVKIDTDLEDYIFTDIDDDEGLLVWNFHRGDKYKWWFPGFKNRNEDLQHKMEPFKVIGEILTPGFNKEVELSEKEVDYLTIKDVSL